MRVAVRAGECTARIDLPSDMVTVTCGLGGTVVGRWTGHTIAGLGTFIDQGARDALDTALRAALYAHHTAWDRVDAMTTSALVTLLAVHATRVELARVALAPLPTDAERAEAELAAEILDHRASGWAS